MLHYYKMTKSCYRVMCALARMAWPERLSSGKGYTHQTDQIVDVYFIVYLDISGQVLS